MARRLIGLDIGTNAVTIAEVTAGDPPRLDMFASGRARARDHARRRGRRRGRGHRSGRPPARRGRPEEGAGTRRHREPARRRPPGRDAADDARRAHERAAVPGRRAHPDPDRGRGPRLRDPRHRRAGRRAASRACRCCSPRRTRRPCSGSSPRSRPVASRSGRSTSSRSRSSAARARRPISRWCGAGVDPARPGERRRRARRAASGAEGIVSFGGGVTAIAVHEDGVPQFVRVLGSGGRELTDAIATELDLPAETAEALKRQLGDTGPDEMVARARTVDRPSAVGAARRGPQLDRLLPQPARLGAAAPRRRHRRRRAAARPARAPVGARRRAGRAARTCASSSHRRHRLRRRGAARGSTRTSRRRSGSRSAAPASARSSTCCPRAAHVDDAASAADLAEA